MSAWIFDEKDVRPDVQLYLPDDWKLRVFHVTSGDSGKKYWVQILHNEGSDHFRDITLCDCSEGKFQQPLSVLGLKVCCKHAGETLDFIKNKK